MGYKLYDGAQRGTGPSAPSADAGNVGQRISSMAERNRREHGTNVHSKTKTRGEGDGSYRLLRGAGKADDMLGRPTTAVAPAVSF